MQTAISSINSSGQRVTTWRRLLAAGAAAVIGSAVANSAVAALLRGVLNVPAAFSPLQAISVLSLTIVGVIAAVLVFAAICRLSVHPVRLFTIVASVALVISWAAPLAAYFANAFPGTSASRIVGVMSLHAIAGVITIALLRTYGTAVR
jgi:glucan phosphoethanolaminetransferase (alkaline phosphatase superfamily)